MEDVQKLVVHILDLLHWESEICCHVPKQLLVLLLVIRRERGWNEHLIS